MGGLKVVPRMSQDRGHADHDWLKTFHTFSFASYYDLGHQEHGPLRVINEDRVSPRKGFGTHSHQEFEIFSYVVSGTIEHNDNMHKDPELLRRGEIQMTSAGTGISHSEHAWRKGDEPIHFLQIWAKPHTSRLTPKYFTRKFEDAEKTNKLVKIVAPVGTEGVIEERNAEGPTPIHSDVAVYASILEPGQTVEGVLKGKTGFFHLIQTSGYNTGPAQGAAIEATYTQGAEEVKGEYKEGDGAYLHFGGTGETKITFTNTSDKNAEFIVFDMEFLDQ